MLTRHSTELTDPGVVPSLADRWSHHTGGTHFKVVPCHWRATAGYIFAGFSGTAIGGSHYAQDTADTWLGGNT